MLLTLGVAKKGPLCTSKRYIERGEGYVGSRGNPGIQQPIVSPVVLVRKKDQTLRFCVDYCQLNSITGKDVFPLPWIDGLLYQLHGKQIFTTLDAKGGYWQIEMAKRKTAI